MRVVLGDALFLDLVEHQSRHGELLGRELLRGDVESDRIDSRVEEFQRLGIGLGGIGHRNGLVYAPVVAVVRSSHIGELAGLRSEKFDAFEILGAVVGTHVESFGGSPYEFALVVCTFKVCRYGRFPLLGRDRRKFGEQLFFFGISHN